jgi:O-antigen/teichoic acid export membrane protein
MVDLKWIAPVLLPSLRYGNWKQVAAILKPSAHFGLIAIGGFLTWQGPVILIQRVLGPSAVALFSLVRVVFQMSRQILSIASATIGQDITILVGQGDYKQLRRLYDLSERIVLFLIPVVSIGSLLLCPVLFAVWLHKRALYSPLLCILMAVVSAVLGIKEHKTQFQSSSNEHEKLAVFIFWGYTSMLMVSVLTMKFYGLIGFMGTWLAWEMVQTWFVLHMNARLFPDGETISTGPIVRLTVFMAVAFGLCIVPAYREASWSLPMVVGSAVGITAVFGIAAYFVFDVDELRELLMVRIRRRLIQA